MICIILTKKKSPTDGCHASVARRWGMRLKLSNTTQTICLSAAALTIAACGGEPSSSSSELFGASTQAITSRQEAETLAIQLLGGRVLTSEEDNERGRDVYEVEVMRDSGSIVEIEFEVSTGRVLEVESDSPMQGDDLNVGEGFLTLQDAIAIARERRAGTVVEWEIERDEDDRRLGMGDRDPRRPGQRGRSRG